MWKLQLGKKWESVELLELKPNRLAYDVQTELNLYGISLQIDGRQIEKALNDAIDVDLEKVGETESTRGRVYIRKGWRGTYYSIKNIRLHVIDFFKWGLRLASSDGNGKILVCATILLELLKQMGVDMGKNKTMVCVALYRASKYHVLTDDNVVMYIEQELQESSYSGMLEAERIHECLLELIDMEIVSIDDGRYEVAQEVYF